jgi:hypothetical protein
VKRIIGALVATLLPPVVSLTCSPTPVEEPFPECMGATSSQSVVVPFTPPTTRATQWKVKAPPPNTTYDLRGFTSTAYPASVSPIALGTTTPAADTCVVGGTVLGTVDPAKTWEYYHDKYNAACVVVTATDWMQVRGLRCDGLEDGIKPEEPDGNTNNVRFGVYGTYLSNIRDDCMENDYTVGGLVSDSLWESCNTGLSERPSKSRGGWTSPADETVTLDHVLIGLQVTLHKEGQGLNALFKWSDSGNHLVIKCSTFYVPEKSLNGADSMALPPETVVDDTDCPDDPTTIVWGGGGPYPGDLRGQQVRVTDDLGVWQSAVQSWKATHGY